MRLLACIDERSVYLNAANAAEGPRGELWRRRRSRADEITVPGKGHFSVLAPTNELIASKILDGTDPTLGIIITASEVDAIGRL
jgi:hypothetical protein